MLYPMASGSRRKLRSFSVSRGDSHERIHDSYDLIARHDIQQRLLCQCHGSRFDITTGAVINGPATEALNIYEVQEADGNIRIRA